MTVTVTLTFTFTLIRLDGSVRVLNGPRVVQLSGGFFTENGVVPVGPIHQTDRRQLAEVRARVRARVRVRVKLTLTLTWAGRAGGRGAWSG